MDVDSAEYNDCIGRVCQQFRICVERSVEDVLLFGDCATIPSEHTHEQHGYETSSHHRARLQNGG